MKALEWLARGTATADSFDALSNYWRGFNNLFAGHGQERQLISEFLRSKLDEQFSQELLDTHMQEVNDLMSMPVIDMRDNGKDTYQYMVEFGRATTAVEKIVALFMVIYQVRCNFEHGQKSPSLERDQTLCRAACPFVAEVVQYAA